MAIVDDFWYRLWFHFGIQLALCSYFSAIDLLMICWIIFYYVLLIKNGVSLCVGAPFVLTFSRRSSDIVYLDRPLAILVSFFIFFVWVFGWLVGRGGIFWLDDGCFCKFFESILISSFHHHPSFRHLKPQSTCSQPLDTLGERTLHSKDTCGTLPNATYTPTPEL